MAQKHRQIGQVFAHFPIPLPILQCFKPVKGYRGSKRPKRSNESVVRRTISYSGEMRFCMYYTLTVGLGSLTAAQTPRRHEIIQTPWEGLIVDTCGRAHLFLPIQFQPWFRVIDNGIGSVNLKKFKAVYAAPSDTITFLGNVRFYYMAEEYH